MNLIECRTMLLAMMENYIKMSHWVDGMEEWVNNIKIKYEYNNVYEEYTLTEIAQNPIKFNHAVFVFNSIINRK